MIPAAIYYLRRLIACALITPRDYHLLWVWRVKFSFTFILKLFDFVSIRFFFLVEFLWEQVLTIISDCSVVSSFWDYFNFISFICLRGFCARSIAGNTFIIWPYCFRCRTHENIGLEKVEEWEGGVISLCVVFNNYKQRKEVIIYCF